MEEGLDMWKFKPSLGNIKTCWIAGKLQSWKRAEEDENVRADRARLKALCAMLRDEGMEKADISCEHCLARSVCFSPVGMGRIRSVTCSDLCLKNVPLATR